MSAHSSDALIIGGGAVGLCCAYYLQKANLRVTIIDQGEVGQACSLHNAGYVCPSHFIPLAAPGVFTQGLKWMFNPVSPLYIKPRLNLDLLSWGWRFARSCNEKRTARAIPFLRDLLVESKQLFLSLHEQLNFPLSQDGLTVLFRTEKGKHACAHEAELAERLTIEAHLLDEAQLTDHERSVELIALGGLFFPGDAHIVPSAFIASMKKYLMNHGVEFFENIELASIRMNNHRIDCIDTNAELFKADHFVLAAGSWSSALAKKIGISMHLQAGKGYSLTVKHPSAKPSRPYILNERRVAITPFNDSLRFAGTMEFAGMDSTINRPRVEAILDSVPMYFGNLPRPRFEDGETWYGFRPVTPDGLPYIGRFRECRNLIAATGHAMLGISLSAVTGKIVSDMTQDISSPFDLALVHPNRFS